MCVRQVLLFRVLASLLLSELFFLVVLLFFLAFCSGSVLLRVVFDRAPFQFDWFILGLFLWPSSMYLLSPFLFCPAFHQVPLILNASLSVFFSYTFLYPALLVVLFWLAFPSVSLFLVCISGVVHMSQPVAG